jgi:hypothetical protein
MATLGLERHRDELFHCCAQNNVTARGRHGQPPYLFDTHWDHEPSKSPSTALRAPSPPVGEKDGMRGFGSWRETEEHEENEEATGGHRENRGSETL